MINDNNNEAENKEKTDDINTVKIDLGLDVDKIYINIKRVSV